MVNLIEWSVNHAPVIKKFVIRGDSAGRRREGALMGLMDKFSAGIERAAQEADKAFEKGKAKVGELQTEMQMDGLAKKLGYLVFDFYRGREVDQVLRQKYLDDMTHLEEQLAQQRAATAAKKEADAAARAAKAQAAGGWPAPGAAPGPEAADGTADSAPGSSVPPATE
jgi:hypothetical protein